MNPVSRYVLALVALEHGVDVSKNPDSKVWWVSFADGVSCAPDLTDALAHAGLRVPDLPDKFNAILKTIRETGPTFPEGVETL